MKRARSCWSRRCDYSIRRSSVWSSSWSTSTSPWRRGEYAGALQTVAAGVRTPDLGGTAASSEFTTETLSRVREQLAGAPATA